MIERKNKPQEQTQQGMEYTACYRQLFPSIKFVKEIPQWIISSDTAAYHPHSKTIWIRNDLGLKTIPILFHELQHWFIHMFLHNKKMYHNKIDTK